MSGWGFLLNTFSSNVIKSNLEKSIKSERPSVTRSKVNLLVVVIKPIFILFLRP